MGTDSKPTINDVARVANVSKKTVSRVINKSPLLSDKTREKVEAVIKEIGFVPNMQARALALRRNFIIAAIHDMGLATLTHTPSPMAFLRRLLGRPENERPFVMFPIGRFIPGLEVPELRRTT